MLVRELWASFKAISYGGNYIGAVVYIDFYKLGVQLLPKEFGRPLIFSGVSTRMVGSTINYAEEIVSKILKQEQLSLGDRDIYDLQTWKGYKGFEKGQFILNKLNFKDDTKKLTVDSWKEIKNIPANFYEMFCCLLSENQGTNISRQGG